jgi:hypothetical protein
MCMKCELRMSKRRVEANRRQLELDRYEYVAVHGRQTINGATFQEVGDQLAALGFLMAQVTQIAENTIRVPHPTRKPAAIQKIERVRDED